MALIREGQTQDAAHKLNLVADTYLIRGNEEKAADLYAEVIELWPADIGPREIVLDMLKQQGRVGEALNQYADMADVYYTMLADPERAIEVYNEGLEYAQINNAEPAQTLRLLKGLADIENQHKKRLLEILAEIDSPIADTDAYEAEIRPSILEGGFGLADFMQENESFFGSVQGILDLAMMLETQALDLYLRFAEKTTDERTQQGRFSIADEENAHLSALGDLMDKKI